MTEFRSSITEGWATIAGGCLVFTLLLALIAAIYAGFAFGAAWAPTALFPTLPYWPTFVISLIVIWVFSPNRSSK